MEHFRHFGDIVVKVMDTAKKPTYHHAKNVGSTAYIRLLLENTLNLMRQICFLSVREQRIFMENAIHQNNALQSCNGRKCASWDVLHPSFKFCAPANYPTNYDQRPGAPLPPNGRELNLPIQGTKQMLRAIRLNVKWSPQCENKTTRWKDKQKVLDIS